jgi:excisionase family DNA binding protein
MKDLPPILTVEELAPLLHLSQHGVRAALRRKELPASRIGRRWIVRRDALERHLVRAEQERAAAPNTTEDMVERAIRGLPARRPRYDAKRRRSA